MLAADSTVVVESHVATTEFGDLFTGFDKQSNCAVAVKTARFATQAAATSRAEDLRKASQIESQHLERIHHVFQLDSIIGVVSDYQESRTVDDIIRTNPMQMGLKTTYQSIAHLVEVVALAVGQVNSAGVIHGNIKPANIIIDEFPMVLSTGLTPLTPTDCVEGHPRQVAYLAPEQVEDNPLRVGPHTDCYGIGLVLYWLLTRRLPFEGPTQRIAQQITLSRPPIPREVDRDIPRELEAICMKALSRRIARRYAHPLEIAEELSRFRSGQPIQAIKIRRETLFKGCLLVLFIMGLIAFIVMSFAIVLPFLTEQ